MAPRGEELFCTPNEYVVARFSAMRPTTDAVRLFMFYCAAS